MEVVLRCENDVQFDTLTDVDFKMLYVVWLADFSVGVTCRLLLSFRVSSLAIN